MATVNEIYALLDQKAPFRTQLGFDNAGFLVGHGEQTVTNVLVALDITEDVAAEAVRQHCELIVSHHPVMNCKWLPVQTVRQDTPQGHLLLKILRSGLSAICVLHDVNLASHYCDKIALLKDGTLYAYGAPDETVNQTSMAEVYGISSTISNEQGRPYVIEDMD